MIMIEFGVKEIAIFLCIINWHETEGQLTLSPDPATVVQGQTLTLTCRSTQPGGTGNLYQFYSLDTDTNRILYGSAVGSFKECNQGPYPSFIFECDFDNRIFNLTVSQPVHNQVIYCNRKVQDIEIMMNTTIYVQVPVQRVTLAPSSAVSVIEGHSFTFTCKAEASRPAANITWHLQERLLSGNDSISPSSNDLFDVTSTLTLTFTKNDQGKALNCSANNIPGGTPKYSEKADLDVLYVPLTSPNLTAVGPTSADEGQLITLRCTLSTLGNPHVTWSWMCGDDPLTTGVTNTGVQSELRLTANRKYNQRTCQCRARTSSSSLTYDKSSETLRITVFYAVNITKVFIEESGEIKAGSPFTMSANIDGNPNSTVEWRNSDANEIVKTDALRYNSSKYHKISASCLDTALYTVIASNRLGSSGPRDIFLSVLCSPYSDGDEGSKPVTVHDTEKFSAVVEYVANPMPNVIKWIKKEASENVTLQNGTNIKIFNVAKSRVNYTSRLERTNVTNKDIGIYELHLGNTEGSYAASIQVIFRRKPNAPRNISAYCAIPFEARIGWVAEFNGGVQQTFSILYRKSRQIDYELYSVSVTGNKGDRPSITVRDLQPNVQYEFKVLAENSIGNVTTLESVHCEIKAKEDASSVAALAGGAAAGGIGLAVVVIVIVIFVRRYSNHEKQTSKNQRLRENGGENESIEDDGLKENALYVSADIANDEKPGPSGMAVYAEVKKKSPGLSDNNANVYAEVKKTGPKVGDDKATNGAAKPKKGLFKKEEKPKPKKGKKQKPKQGVPDVYENSEDIAMKQRADDVYSNTGDNRPPKPEQRGYKNQDGLLYVEVQFDAKKDNGKSVIHGEEEKTDYATVEFPFPPPSQKAAEGEKKEK